MSSSNKKGKKKKNITCDAKQNKDNDHIVEKLQNLQLSEKVDASDDDSNIINQKTQQQQQEPQEQPMSSNNNNNNNNNHEGTGSADDDSQNDNSDSDSEKRNKKNNNRKQREPRQQSKKKEKAQAKEQLRREAVRKAFLEYYRKQFGDRRWAQLLPALEKPTRYCCLINRFADPAAVTEPLTRELDKEHVKPLPFASIPCLMLDNDETNTKPFPQPVRDMNNLLNYYLLDAASVLCAEALDVQPNDLVLDMCAAPGGKSLAILQKLLAPKQQPQQQQQQQQRQPDGSIVAKSAVLGHGRLVCNEMAPERRRRLRTVIESYLPAELKDRVTVTGHDGTKWHQFEADLYDKVLVDAPCSSDRHLLHDPEELAQWTPSRTKNNAERQVALLQAAVQSVRPGGTVVYATCSMSEVENDGVVEKVLKKSKVPLRLEKKKKWGVGEPTKLGGWIVLPDTGDRWGPLYFAILHRLSEDEDDEDDYSDDDE